MSDKMRPIPFGAFMDWILWEYHDKRSLFGVDKLYTADQAKRLPLFGESIETPFGPAAGPHTQLCQNIVAAYAAGARFFELKTVQTLDGEDLPVSKPCIAAKDECYNVEWSTELRVPDAMDEYIKAWFALKLISREFGLGAPDGFVFNMSVGYDLEGIQSAKIDGFIEGLKNAQSTAIWRECKNWAEANLARFKNIDVEYLAAISPKVCNSITLSTLHGCPPAEIERIAAYLIREKNLNTFVKCNPTMLGYEFARKTADELGFDYLVFDDHHFKADLQFADAVPMLRRLMALADEKGLAFGVKLTNTFPVTIAANELPGDEMYMSGRVLFPLSLELANRLTKEFGGGLRISYSGGADIWNIAGIVDTGIWPVTLATTLLKPGGYGRLLQMAEKLIKQDYKPFTGVDAAKLQALVDDSRINPHYRKPIKPLPERKLKKQVPLVDCFTAPCRGGCPIEQDIPVYLRLAGEGKYLEALRVITERNPLPFITGTICPHHCGDKCTRGFYEESIQIRGVKLLCAQMARDQLLCEIEPPAQTGARVAVVGGGPAGLAAAYFLAKAGSRVTVFEKRASLGGIVRHVIPGFRISDEAIESDIALIKAMGVAFELGREVKSVEELRDAGFKFVVLAVGAWSPGSVRLQTGEAMNVIEFLADAKENPANLKLGKHAVVIGGGNTAMDAARAAKRVPGVESVSLVYRRSKRYMPADEEELALALADGVEFRELLAPVGIKDGVLTCEVMKLGKPDASGRRSPEPTGEMLDIPADTVIAAVGERIDAAFYERSGVSVENGRPVVDADTMETELPGVFAIGDGKSGPATVVEAIADAQKAANAITKAHQNRYADWNAAGDYAAAKAKQAVLFPDIFETTEPERCLECATVCECCVQVCPNRANVALDVNGCVQIVHIDAMCNECGNCETFCPYSSAPYKDKFTLFACDEDFENSENSGVAPSGKARLDGAVIDMAELPAELFAIAEEAFLLPRIVIQ